jgi:predicted membrane channel-forming protein YqfA (hemolysin III family)
MGLRSALLVSAGFFDPALKPLAIVVQCVYGQQLSDLQLISSSWETVKKKKKKKIARKINLRMAANLDGALD